MNRDEHNETCDALIHCHSAIEDINNQLEDAQRTVKWLFENKMPKVRYVKDLSDNIHNLEMVFEDVKWCVEWAIDALEDWQYEFGEGETTDE